MKITRKSPFSGKINSMDLEVTAAQLVRYDSGELIQNVFPHLSADEREFIKTGILPSEWESMFGGAE